MFSVKKRSGEGPRSKVRETATPDRKPFPKDQQAAVIVEDLDGTIVSWNPAAARITGYSDDEVMGNLFALLISPKMKDEIPGIFERVRRGEPVHDVEASVLTKRGQEVLLSLTVLPVKDDRGEVVGARSYFKEVRAHEKIEEVMKDPGEQYRMLAEDSRVGIVVLQRGFIRFVNPWGVHALGHPEDRLISAQFTRFVHPDDQEKVAGHQRDIEAGRDSPGSVTFKLVDRAGETSHLIMHATTFQWQGEPATMNLLTDLTSRVQLGGDLPSVLEESPDAVLVVDRDGIIQAANEHAIALFDKKGDLLGQPFGFPIVEGDMTEIEILSGFTTYATAEMRVVNVEWKDRPAYLVSLQDITEKKKLEEDLRNSEQVYRQLITTMHEGAWFIDKKGNTTFVNARMAEMLGYGAEEMHGRPFFSFTEPRYKKVARAWLQMRNQGIREKNEFEFVKKDGTPLYAIVSTAPIANKAGKFMGSIAVVVDITDRKQAVDALRKSEDKYRALVENSPDLIARFDRDGRFVYANPAMSAVLNIPSGTLIGRRIDELGFSPRDAAEWNDAIRNVFSEAGSRQLRIRFTAQKGEMVLDWRLIPEFDGEGHITTVLSLQRDITEVQRAQDKIRHLASFTQLNPNPILELDAKGKVLFSNVATKLALRRVGAPENPDLFKPTDLPGILRELSQGNQALFYREVEIRDAVFGERIFLTPEQGTVRIYATDITPQR